MYLAFLYVSKPLNGSLSINVKSILMQLLSRAFSLAFTIIFLASCSSDSVEEILANEQEPIDLETAIIWDGPALSFTKENGADPTDEANQDRITDNVWITRDNDGGPIFNARVESENNNNGPTGTRWAIGSLDNIENLNFQPLRQALGGQRTSFQDAMNQDMVLFLQEDNIYLSIRFSNWSSGKQGGFAYERSTMPE